MFNIFFTGFPSSYMGYELNTDYRVGIRIVKLMDSDILKSDVNTAWLLIFQTLYKVSVPEDLDIAFDGVRWFLTSGQSELYYADDPPKNTSSDIQFDYDIDQFIIWSAFRKLGIDLTKVNMHWFKFQSLMNDLPECTLSTKIGYRTADTSKMTGEYKDSYTKLKNDSRIRKLITKEEYDAIKEFKTSVEGDISQQQLNLLNSLKKSKEQNNDSNN